MIEAKWIPVSERLPVRTEAAYGEIELYCKRLAGDIEICVFYDYDQSAGYKLETGYFDDSSVTEWLSIPSVTLAS